MRADVTGELLGITPRALNDAWHVAINARHKQCRMGLRVLVLGLLKVAILTRGAYRLLTRLAQLYHTRMWVVALHAPYDSVLALEQILVLLDSLPQ